jgi:L-lactate dehydrogenase complex protein LldF
MTSKGYVDHVERAARVLADAARVDWHDAALWQVRTKRDNAARRLPEWEHLRELASAIKTHTLSELPRYLEQFEAAAVKRGAIVHFARDADEHNRIVADILRAEGVTKVVKSKSMLTEECGLNPYLQARGFEVTDTDLGEFIVQLRHEPPSHIVLPAIHLKREDVGETFTKLLSAEPTSDPQKLAEFARRHLRQKFLAAEAAITGVNFAVAETGGIVVCTNEGNADLGMALPPIHIACVGIEKLIPRPRDLGVFLRLLARSATGQAITSYTSHIHGPRRGQVLHIILVDNGRSQMLAEEKHRGAFKCIRCGACMNTCPVFRRTGGHSYGTEVPGPIGSILAPLRNASRHRTLPFACSLCASCSNVCPVRVDLHAQLLLLRQRLTDAKLTPFIKRFVSILASKLLAHPGLFRWSGRMGRTLVRFLPVRFRHWLFRAYEQGRTVPELPAQSFHDWYRHRKGMR